MSESEKIKVELIYKHRLNSRVCNVEVEKTMCVFLAKNIDGDCGKSFTQRIKENKENT